MNKEEKIAPFTEFYKQVVFAETTFDVNYKEVAKVLFNEVDRLNNIIDKAIEFIEEWCTINPTTGKCVCYLNKNRCTELYKILGDKEKEV